MILNPEVVAGGLTLNTVARKLLWRKPTYGQRLQSLISKCWHYSRRLVFNDKNSTLIQKKILLVIILSTCGPHSTTVIRELKFPTLNVYSCFHPLNYSFTPHTEPLLINSITSCYNHWRQLHKCILNAWLIIYTRCNSKDSKKKKKKKKRCFLE